MANIESNKNPWINHNFPTQAIDALNDKYLSLYQDISPAHSSMKIYLDPMPLIAALYVETYGCYYGLPNVDPWDEKRDARKYNGPYPVVAHPPCERWGRYWSGGPMLAGTPKAKKLGDDGGCFKSALEMVRKYGGVIEHPEGSHAWRAHDLNIPPRSGGWVNADFQGGFTCCVEQGAYGHRARKATWLYACGVNLPSLKWGRAHGNFDLLDDGFHSTEERRRKIKTGICQRLSKKQRLSTPIEFRDLLIRIAESAIVDTHPPQYPEMGS